MAARLYAEAVTMFATGSVTMSLHEYNGLRGTVKDTQRSAQALGTAFEEHIESHWREGESTVA